MGYVDLPLDWHTSLYSIQGATSIPGATPLKTILTTLALSATATLPSRKGRGALEGAKDAHTGVEKTNDDFDRAGTIEPYRSAFCRSRHGGRCALAYRG